MIVTLAATLFLATSPQLTAPTLPWEAKTNKAQRKVRIGSQTSQQYDPSINQASECCVWLRDQSQESDAGKNSVWCPCGALFPKIILFFSAPCCFYRWHFSLFFFFFFSSVQLLESRRGCYGSGPLSQRSDVPLCLRWPALSLCSSVSLSWDAIGLLMTLQP